MSDVRVPRETTERCSIARLLVRERPHKQFAGYGWQREQHLGTSTWRRSLHLGRWQFTLTIYRHRYAMSSDRWVIQTSTVYDRKELKP